MQYGNPYMNPYALQQPYQGGFQQQQQVVKVNGEPGARAYQLGANSSALLLDESGTLVWLVVTDGAGYKTVTPYDISPHQAAQARDYSDLESRIARLEGIINDTANSAATKRKPDGKPTGD